MKTIRVIAIILIFLLGFNYTSEGQVLSQEKNRSPQEQYDFHIKKMKSNRTAAWITLGGGAGMLISGVVINISENIFDDSSKGLVLAGVGLATSLVSIPLFAAGRKHKNQAKIQLQNGAVGFNNEFRFSGISISFSF
ncbi:hypothetical protein [Tamlana sp. I1]|uniref:hypothetical protein n=1 Tax=Tamlana sp. I1 TaxID=2762061 RepID=UPI00188EF2C4|nr:hypothetical protein [Tamlana sp. I1]